jgi:hypothetical protein
MILQFYGLAAYEKLKRIIRHRPPHPEQHLVLIDAHPVHGVLCSCVGYLAILPDSYSVTVAMETVTS